MRFYTKPHKLYSGIDLHARTMYICILNQDGEILVHRKQKKSPLRSRVPLDNRGPHKG